MFLPVSVCLSVCLLDYSKNQLWTDFDKFLKGWTNRLDFGGDADHDTDPIIIYIFVLTQFHSPSGSTNL